MKWNVEMVNISSQNFYHSSSSICHNHQPLL